MTIYYAQSTSGFYSSDIHSDIPADAVSVTDEQHSALLNAQASGALIRADAAGMPVAVDPKSSLTLDQIKASKVAELSADFAQRMGAVKAGYPDDEIQSWLDQKSEAMAYVEDTRASTPLLSAMATARGLTIADLAARVLVNASKFAIAAGALIGKRQRYEDDVNAAADVAAVAAVIWID